MINFYKKFRLCSYEFNERKNILLSKKHVAKKWSYCLKRKVSYKRVSRVNVSLIKDIRERTMVMIKKTQTITWENYLIVKYLCVLRVSLGTSFELLVLHRIFRTAMSPMVQRESQVRVSTAALTALWTFIIIFSFSLFSSSFLSTSLPIFQFLILKSYHFDTPFWMIVTYLFKIFNLV